MLVALLLVILNMALPNAVKTVGSLILGRCIPSLKHNASRFNIQYYYFDDYLNAYFLKSFKLFAYDPQKICKTGDIALIQELPKRMSETVTHKVLEVVYPHGDVTDPITGKKVVASEFREDIEMLNSLYGSTQPKFDYKTAPRRGWQEGRKDFSHRATYRKYNEFDEGDENRHQPDSVLV